MNSIVAFTDGACIGNQYSNAKGGYGVTLFSNGQRVEFSQGYQDTTNNRMELRAVIAALKYYQQPVDIEIHSDSKYVLDAFTQGWIEKWKRNDWKNSKRRLVKNYDLWQELLPLTEKHNVCWLWVQGHEGNIENERADQLARTAATSSTLLMDKGLTVTPSI